MSKAGKQAWICWGVAALGLIAGLRFWMGPAAGAEGGGEAIGRLVALTGAAALATWFVARRQVPGWGWARFAIIYVCAVILLAVISASGRSRAEDFVRSFPLALDTPDGWNVEQLEGLSSQSQDRLLGNRLRQQWNGADGNAVLEASCAWIDRNETGVPEAELEKVLRQLGKAYVAQGLQVTSSRVRSESHAGRTWAIADLEVSRDESAVLSQRTAMSRSPQCALSVVLAASPLAFAATQARFVDALLELQAD
jgi:hypothetical protein